MERGSNGEDDRRKGKEGGMWPTAVIDVLYVSPPCLTRGCGSLAPPHPLSSARSPPDLQVISGVWKKSPRSCERGVIKGMR